MKRSPPPDCADFVSQNEAILERFLALHPKIIDLSLARVETLLDRLGNPHEHLPPVFHVAGTNGKGSTIAFLDACLQADGRSVHAYTSPHLVGFNERIRLDGEAIHPERLYQLLRHCEEVNGGDAITYFEITSAAAFLAFRETPADVLLLEVGLGGRLDATNVVASPEMCVLTPVGLDHQQFLGESIEEIAAEKAGILKEGTGAVVAPQETAASQIIEARAEELNAPLYRYGKEWRISRQGDGLLYEDEKGVVELPLPGLFGAHQIINAGAAVAALRHSRFAGINVDALKRGVERTRWRARLQRLENGALFEAVGEGELWLDGGHNPAAARILREAMEEMNKARPNKPLHLVAGMMDTKDAQGFFAEFKGLAQSIATIPIPTEQRSASAKSLLAEAQAAGIKGEAFDSLLEACRAGEGCRVLLCGSLYLAGHVLAEYGNQPESR